MKKICMILVLCLLVMLPCCKKKLPTQPDIPTKVLPTIEYFHATPESVVQGEVSILSWSTKNATNVKIDQGIGTVSAKDTMEVSPEETTTYTLTAINSDGQKTQSCKVEVRLLPVIEYFTASPESITQGEVSVLSWSVTNATTLYISPPGLDVSGSVGMPVEPTETTTYTLIATNDEGETKASCKVEVTGRAIFELTSYGYGYTEYDCCKIMGFVQNVGNATGYNVMIVFQAYVSDIIVDTASGFPADLGSIPVGDSALFEAIFFDLCGEFAWDVISEVTYEITWLTAQGMSMTQIGVVRNR